MKGKIDFHHHIVPDFYRDAINSIGLPVGDTPTPEWSPELQRHAMEVLGIEKAYMSVTEPGPLIYPDDERRRQLARQINDYSKHYSDTDPEHLGFYASLPSLLDTEGTLAEIEYAHNVLKTDKFIIFTSYKGSEGDHYYLGHDRFASIWDKFNTIKAIVLIHPNNPPTKPVDVKLLFPFMDFTFETCRTGADLIANRHISHTCPHVKIILSHGGGVLPMISMRISGALAAGETKGTVFPTVKFMIDVASNIADFKFFYFDTALVGGLSGAGALYGFAEHEKILYGSDFPYASLEQISFLDSIRPHKIDLEFDINKTYENGKALLKKDKSIFSRHD
jgi:6-methylsalicylate decarboxylase